LLFLLILLFIFILLVYVPQLIKKKYWRDLIVFCSLLFISFALSFLQLNGVTIPSPIKGMDFLVKDLLHFNY
jgi:hypothetical protein